MAWLVNRSIITRAKFEYTIATSISAKFHIFQGAERGSSPLTPQYGSNPSLDVFNESIESTTTFPGTV
jgi:hypothetical protein